MLKYSENYGISGDDYETHIDLTDDALRRRQIFLQYNPSKDDFLNFIHKNSYHPIITELAEYLPISSIIDHETGAKELMQPTTFGSWDLLNKRWNAMEATEVLDYSEAKKDIVSKGSMFFTDKTISDVTDKLTLLEELNTIDLQKEIIDKNGLDKSVKVFSKKGEVYQTEGREKQIQIKIMNFVRREVLADHNYLLNNIHKLLKVFKDENPLIIVLIKQIQNDILRAFGKDGVQTKESQEKTKAIFLGTVEAIRTQAATDDSVKQLWSDFQSLWTHMNQA